MLDGIGGRWHPTSPAFHYGDLYEVALVNLSTLVEQYLAAANNRPLTSCKSGNLHLRVLRVILNQIIHLIRVCYALFDDTHCMGDDCAS
jgi:hypothetical protein